MDDMRKRLSNRNGCIEHISCGRRLDVMSAEMSITFNFCVACSFYGWPKTFRLLCGASSLDCVANTQIFIYVHSCLSHLAHWGLGSGGNAHTSTFSIFVHFIDYLRVVWHRKCWTITFFKRGAIDFGTSPVAIIKNTTDSSRTHILHSVFCVFDGIENDFMWKYT